MSQIVYYTPDSEIKTEGEALALLLGKKWVPRIIEILSQGPQRLASSTRNCVRPQDTMQQLAEPSQWLDYQPQGVTSHTK